MVAYRQIDADEPLRTVAVRSPSCGAVNRLAVSGAAARASDYRAERIGAGSVEPGSASPDHGRR